MITLTDIEPGTITALQVVVDYRCSRRCSYCYNALLNQRTSAVPDRQMETFRRLVEMGPLSVEVIGGEPLLASVLPRTIEWLMIARGHPNVTTVVLNTAEQSHESLPSLLPLLDGLYISVDLGPDSVGRNWKPLDVGGLEATARRSQAAGVALEIAVTLSGSESPGDLKAFVQDLIGIGVARVGFGHVVARLGDDRLRRAYQDLFYELFQLRLACRGAIDIGGALLENVENAILQRRRSLGCACGVSSLSLEPDGTLSPGVLFEHAKPARITHQMFRDVQERRRSRLTGSQPCVECPMRWTCQGGCAGVAQAESGALSNLERCLCDLQRGVFAKVATDLEIDDP